MNNELVKRILLQAPDNITETDIIKLLENYNDENDILCKLWDIQDKPIKNINYNSDKEKWDNIRDICDSHDEEMAKFLKEARNKQNTKQETIEEENNNIEIDNNDL